MNVENKISIREALKKVLWEDIFIVVMDLIIVAQIDVNYLTLSVMYDLPIRCSFKSVKVWLNFSQFIYINE